MRARVTIAGLLTLTLGAALTGCGGSSAGDDGADSVVIGLVCDTTGPGAGYATPACNATKATIDEVNAGGGIDGKKIKVVQGNDESDPTKTPTVIQKMVSQGADALIMLTSSAGVLQAKSLIERTRIPVFMSVAANPLVTEPPSNTYLYQLGTPTSDWATVYCEAFASLGAKKVAFLQDSSPSQVQFNQGLIDGLDCVDLEVVNGAIDATDLSPEVAKIEKAGADAVLVATQNANFDVLAQNTLHQQLPGVPRFTELLLSSLPSAWKQAQPGALEGLVGLAGTTDTNPKTVEVAKLFAETEGADFQVNNFWTQSYDAVQLLKQAIESAGSTDGTKVNDALQKITDYEAASGYPGFTLSFGKDKHLGADGICGLVLVTWGADNTVTGPWADYTPDCAA